MYFVELSGEARGRGQAYGETLRGPIHEHIDRFWSGLTQGSGLDPHAFIHQWLGEVNFLPPIEAWTPSLLDEVRGIGEGAGLDFETILSWQFLDELSWYLNSIYLPRLQGKTAADGQAGMNCSSFGVSSRAGHPALLAQNWDSNVLLDGSQTLLHIHYPNDEYELFILASAGRIGPFGVSSRGLGVCLNSLSEFLNYSMDGLPVVFVGRGVLEQADFQAASAFVQAVPHASAQAYSVGGPQGTAVFECSGNQVQQYIPASGADQVVHTNHPLASTDLRIQAEELGRQSPAFRAERKVKEANSLTRFDSLRGRMEAAGRAFDLETAKAMLRSHDSPDFPVCTHPRPDSLGATMLGMIVEFRDPPVLHVASGRPCENAFCTYTFNEKSDN